MAAKKKNEFREKDYSRNTEALKQRRLKNESRWKFNPNASYETEDDDVLDEEDWFEESEHDDRR